MPELAEVETVRRQIDSHLKNHVIKEIEIDPSDKILFQYVASKKFQDSLKGAKILGTGRKGKYFWLELNRRPWPIFHLGMSGNVALIAPQTKNVERKKRAATKGVWEGAKLWRERIEDLRDKMFFCRLLLILNQKAELALIDPRRFGRVFLADDPLQFPRIKKLGFDPLIDFPSASVIGERLAKRNKAIKSVLLDQSLFAGIGNWLADEILFQAKLNPHRKANELSPKEIKTLHRQILNVCEKAVELDADYERFPKTWLFNDRWGKGRGKENAKAASRRKIQFDEIGGRTTAWVPSVQK